MTSARCGHDPALGYRIHLLQIGVVTEESGILEYLVRSEHSLVIYQYSLPFVPWSVSPDLNIPNPLSSSVLSVHNIAEVPAHPGLKSVAVGSDSLLSRQLPQGINRMGPLLSQ